MANKNMDAKISLPNNFTPASEKSSINASDNIITAFSKTAKYLNDLGSAAYTDSSSYAANIHNQASNTINAMTGYSKPSTTSAINSTDTLNEAIGKLEKALDSTISANNGCLTIQRNGTNVATFYADQANDTIANISVPTKTSDLTNDSGYITTAVRYDTNAQGLNTTQKSNARTNIGLGNVDNKSSATIRSEITSSNVTNALGYTPVNKAGDTMTGDLHFSDDDSASLDIGYDSSTDLFKIWSLNKDIDIEGGNVYICGGSGNGVIIDGAVFFKGTLSSSGATDIRVLAIDVNNRGKLMRLNNSELADKVPAVRYDTSSQGLTTTQKSNARTNLGLGSAAIYSYGSFATSTQGGYATDFNSNFKPIFTTSGQSHASVFRGKYLGSSFTYAQKAAIANGTFDDLYIGDYWTINSMDWVIADIDYYYGIGDTACWTHHLVIVPRYTLTSSTMNASSTSSGGYNGSKMRTSTLLCNSTTAGNTSTVYGKICAAFGINYILSHRVLVSTSVDSSGNVSGWAWSDSIVDLLNQSQVCGQKVSSNGNKDVYNVGVQTTQLAVFRINHGSMIAQSGTTRTGYWLSDVRSATNFALIYANGAVDSNGASNSYSVRPHFCLKGV